MCVCVSSAVCVDWVVVSPVLLLFDCVDASDTADEVWTSCACFLVWIPALLVSLFVVSDSFVVIPWRVVIARVKGFTALWR